MELRFEENEIAALAAKYAEEQDGDHEDEEVVRVKADVAVRGFLTKDDLRFAPAASAQGLKL